jgi:hypothetical protein
MCPITSKTPFLLWRVQKSLQFMPCSAPVPQVASTPAIFISSSVGLKIRTLLANSGDEYR